MTVATITPAEILTFWREVGPDRWFEADTEIDQKITKRFRPVHEAAVRGDLAAFEESAEGALALVILLDQFSRNMFRGSARAFAADPLARAVAARAIVRGFDRAVDETMRPFYYMPFMHSEVLADQHRSVELFATCSGNWSDYAAQHRDVVQKFGRFPYRNLALGRDSTPAEHEFLKR